MLIGSTLPKNDTFADLLATIVVLTRGTYDGGKPCWAYVALKPSMASSYINACKVGNVNVEEYGTLLECGDGENPTDEIATRMQRDFGANSSLEEKLQDIIKQFA